MDSSSGIDPCSHRSDFEHSKDATARVHFGTHSIRNRVVLEMRFAIATQLFIITVLWNMISALGGNTLFYSADTLWSFLSSLISCPGTIVLIRSLLRKYPCQLSLLRSAYFERNTATPALCPLCSATAFRRLRNGACARLASFIV